MCRSIALNLALTVTALMFPLRARCAGFVTYGGTLYSETGQSVQGGRVIVGNFKPGFNVSNFACTYSDPVCNPYENNYSLAVADGNFIPLDSGVVTNNFGVFSGSGFSNAPSGTQFWLFAFPGSQPLGTGGEVLASGTSASFFMSAEGSASLSASAMNQIIFGRLFSNGIQLTGLPVPEPTAGGLVLLGYALSASYRQWRRSFHCA